MKTNTLYFDLPGCRGQAKLEYPKGITDSDINSLAAKIETRIKFQEGDRIAGEQNKSPRQAEIKQILCLNDKIEITYIQEGKAVCTATHPDSPIQSKKSRGRKAHLSKDGEFTVCNMLIDGFIPGSEYFNFQQVKNGKCMNCFKER